MINDNSAESYMVDIEIIARMTENYQLERLSDEISAFRFRCQMARFKKPEVSS